MATKYTLKQIAGVLSHIIENNRFLEANNKKPIAVEIVGESGIGKTSLIEQIAQEKNKSFVKRNFSQIEELGDLVGFPLREFLTAEGDWVNEKQVDTNNYNLTGETRTVHCPPSWIPKECPNGGILLLDDYSRAQPRFIQATMELINRGEYDDWKVPMGWTIILTSNPDNGKYLVSSMDEAQKTRFISLEADFNVQEWAEWAEANEIDSRCINFVLLHEEVIQGEINARIATEFFNSIASLSNFSEVNNLKIIQTLGSGSVGEEFTTTFILFINNRLDKLPSPRYIMENDDEEAVILDLKKAVGTEGEDYKNSVAGALVQRLINYNKFQLKTKKRAKESTVKRIENIICSDIFAADAKLFLVKEFSSLKQFENLMLNEEIRKHVRS